MSVCSIRLSIIFLLAPLTSFVLSTELSLPDSLHLQLWGGAQITDQQPAGLKGNESGIIDAWVKHSFTDAIFCTVYLEGAQDFPTPFIEEASLGYKHNDFSARAGMLFTRIGRASLYKPFSVFNQFTRTSVIWDSYGFGLALDSRPGGMGLSGAATLNSRENGAAHILWTALDNSSVTERVLVGVQTGELATQDNSLTVGNDLAMTFAKAAFHVAARYSAYQGYGNPTIKPGYLVELFSEARVVPTASITVSGMLFYEDFDKSYTQHSFLGGLDAQYMMIRWLGMYAGYEYLRQNDNVGASVPQLGMALVPVSDRIMCRIGMESTITGEAYLNRITALLWFVF
jgi:hypothetical protein